MVRFVAVAVDQHDIPWCEQRLLDYFVRSRSAIGYKECSVGTKGSGGLFLGDLDVSRWLQETVETASGCRRLCQEKVDPIKPAHIANPIRFENRFASRDWQGVECSDRTLGIFLEVVEIGSVKAICDAIKNAKV